jgi:hypothetical protein
MPGVGWGRGDQAIDPKLIQELENLRLENKHLQEQLNIETGDEVRFPTHLLGPDGIISAPVHVTYFGEDGPYGNRTEVRSEEIETTIALGQLFDSIFDSILTEPAESKLQSVIGGALWATKGQSDQKSEGRVSDGVVTNLRTQFEALGLIEAVGREHVSSMAGHAFRRDYIAWTVTSKGRRFVSGRRAIKSDSTMPKHT